MKFVLLMLAFSTSPYPNVESVDGLRFSDLDSKEACEAKHEEVQKLLDAADYYKDKKPFWSCTEDKELAPSTKLNQMKL